MILKVHNTSVELITTGDFMSRFCGTLSLPRDVQKAATHIAKKAVDLDIVPGRSPISVAAAAIYMASQASDDKRTQREIADIAGKSKHFFKYCLNFSIYGSLCEPVVYTITVTLVLNFFS